MQSKQSLLEVADIIKNIENEEYLWSTLLFDHEFASIVKSRVHTLGAMMEMQVAPCSYEPYTRTTSLRYGHSTLHQSRFVMPPRSLTGLGPYPQLQLDAPMNEAFPQQKQSPNSMLTQVLPSL